MKYDRCYNNSLKSNLRFAATTFQTVVNVVWIVKKINIYGILLRNQCIMQLDERHIAIPPNVAEAVK